MRGRSPAVLREGIDPFPAAFLDERALEIRLLCDHREDLVAERTRIINRLRRHPVDLCPQLEASIPSRHLDRPRTLERVSRRCAPANAPRGCASRSSSCVASES